MKIPYMNEKIQRNVLQRKLGSDKLHTYFMKISNGTDAFNIKALECL